MTFEDADYVAGGGVWTVGTVCPTCGASLQIGSWPFCAGGHEPRPFYVIDDSLDGGPRVFDTMGHDSPFIESKSQWRREVEQRDLVHVDTHDASYYATRARRNAERRKDLGLD